VFIGYFRARSKEDKREASPKKRKNVGLKKNESEH